MKVEKKGMACGHPRLVTEKVHRFNSERKEQGLRGGLWIRTFDIQDFFTKVDRTIFAEDVRTARARKRERFGQDIMYF